MDNINANAIISAIGLAQDQLLKDYSGISVAYMRTNNANNNTVQDGTEYVVPTFDSAMTTILTGNGLIIPDNKKCEIEFNERCIYYIAMMVASPRIPTGSSLTNIYSLISSYVWNHEATDPTSSSIARTRCANTTVGQYTPITVLGCQTGFEKKYSDERKTVAPVFQSGISVSDINFLVIAFS